MQEQDCAVLDSDLNWGWNDLSCRISAFTVCRGKPSRCPSPPTAEGTTVTLADSNKLTYHCVVGQMPIGKEIIAVEEYFVMPRFYVSKSQGFRE